MFSILVHGNDTAWETDQLMRMDKGRFKEHSDSEHENIVLDRPETLKALETVPALLMYEVGCQNASTVRFGFLRNIRILHQDLVFTFLEQGILDRATVTEYATRLGFQNLGGRPDSLDNQRWRLPGGMMKNTSAPPMMRFFLLQE